MSAVLRASTDMFNGVLVDADDLPSGADDFQRRLAHSLTVWRREARRGVWLRLRAEQAAAGLVQVAVRLGFAFHSITHSGALQLTLWLPDEPSTLPRGPHTSVGVGAFVLHPDGDRVLVVKERVGVKLWKMPTGLVEAGEEIDEAARREVLEETGVATDASCRIAAFRSQHGALNATGEASNLFFVVVLRALHTAIRLQESEIADARWCTFAEFAKMSGSPRGVYGALNGAALAVAQSSELGLAPADLPMLFLPDASNRVFRPAAKL